MVGVMSRMAFAISAVGSAAMLSCPATALAVAAPTVAGTWTGPFTGANFTFEFTKGGDSWTGRYQSDKFHKWHDLLNVQVDGGRVRFSFESEPPSSFALEMTDGGSELSGTAQFGSHQPLPLVLKRTPGG